MPLRFARGHAAALALTVAAIACGVALVCAIDLATRAALRAFVDVLDASVGRSSLVVSAGEGGIFPESVAERVAAVPGVLRVHAVVRGVLFTTDTGGERLTVHGVDVTDGNIEDTYGLGRNSGSLLEDPLVFVSQPDSVAVTQAFATRRGLGLGDTVTLVAPSGRRPFTIRGLLELNGVARAFGANLVLMDLFAAEELFARPRFINGIDVVLGPETDRSAVAAAIARVLPAGVTVGTPAQRQADLQRVMRSLHVVLDAAALFGIAAAFLITFNRLSAVFERRAWQLGVLRAVGARQRDVWRTLMAESLFVGAAGVALGLPLGIGIGRLVVPAIATTAALAHKLVLPEASYTVSPASLVLAAVLGLAASVLAAALPARRAARTALAETIRTRGTEAPGTERAGLLPFAVAISLALVTLVVERATHAPAAGLTATALLAIGIALAARPLLTVAGPMLATASRRLGGPIGWFASMSLLRNPRRTALTMGTVGVGLGCVVWLWTITTSFQYSLAATLTAAVRADLVVSSTHIDSGYVEAPLDEAVAHQLAALPGVTVAVGSRVIDWPYRRHRIAVEAIDAVYFRRPELGQWPLFGRRLGDVWERVAAGTAVVASANFAANAGVRVGERLVLDTPSGPLELQVGGITAAFESPEGTLLLARETYIAHWRDRRLTRIGIHAASGTNVPALRERIARELGATYDLRILSARELIEHYTGEVRRAFAPLRVLAVLVLLVTLFGVADTLAAGVLERTRDLGVVRAVGIGRRRLALTVLAESLLLGGLGLALAVSGGLALAVLWVEHTIPLLLGWALDLHLPHGELPLLLGATTAVCLVAALGPALRAARLPPQAALRCE
jgi:putative ABC transport system permease protein